MPVNLDKREYIYPHQLGDGLKLVEQGMSGPGGTATALIVLLPCSSGRGGGDFRDESGQVVGRWAGDRIAIVGDYAEDGDLDLEHEAGSIYWQCQDDEPEVDAPFTNITPLVREYLEATEGVKYGGDGWLTRRL